MELSSIYVDPVDSLIIRGCHVWPDKTGEYGRLELLADKVVKSKPGNAMLVFSVGHLLQPEHTSLSLQTISDATRQAHL